MHTFRRCDLPSPAPGFSIIYGRLTRMAFSPDMMQCEAYRITSEISLPKIVQLESKQVFRSNVWLQEMWGQRNWLNDLIKN